MSDLPRLLIEEWLPAAAMGVECIRENSTGQHPPPNRLHVWWARRPLVASRAAVLGSLLPADFPREVFERLLGFGLPGHILVDIRRVMDTGRRVEGGFNCDRAFKRGFFEKDLGEMFEEATRIWGPGITLIDPMAGGGSIPLEAARLGFNIVANEYNPVACSVLEATVDYPLRFGKKLEEKTRKWAKVWAERIQKRIASFYPKKLGLVHAYIFARTVPCPHTGYYTPLVPDWHLLKPKSGRSIGAVPIVDKQKGNWKVEIKEIGAQRDQIRQVPRPTYSDGKGISLFTDLQIPADYIKAIAQQGRMWSALYSVAVKTPQGLRFEPPTCEDFDALKAAEAEMARLRPAWEQDNIIPNEERYKGDCDRSFVYGLTTWAGMFSPRQLLAMGVLMEELKHLRPEIIVAEGKELGEAAVHLLAMSLDKFLTQVLQ